MCMMMMIILITWKVLLFSSMINGLGLRDYYYDLLLLVVFLWYRLIGIT